MEDISSNNLNKPEVCLSDIVLRQSRESAAVLEQFFTAEVSRIVECSHAMAEAFNKGGRLFTMGNGGSSCDALHLSVEFLHPILQKRPPLPATALTTDTAMLTAIGNDQDFALVYAQQLKMLARPGDILVGISTSGKSASITRGFKAGRETGMLSIAFTGKDGGALPSLCDYCFVAPSFSIPRIQEAHAVLLHILWDLVHVIRGEEDVL